MGKTYRKSNIGIYNIEPTLNNDVKICNSRSRICEDKCKCKNNSIRINKNMSKNIYYGKFGNVPNKPNLNITDEELFNNFNYKWTKNDNTTIDTLDTIIKNKSELSVSGDINYIKASKKQIERRYELGMFLGHRKY